ncbi:MAG: BlaI/MecI/CopY family transcriptional regulator [Pirellulaceae bacterium]
MLNARELPALSKTQWEIMNVIWEREECSVADVWRVLNERRTVARNTVQTQIVRLEEKGWLTHRDERGSGFLYAATVSREESQKSSVQQLIETVFDSSPEGLVLTLLNGGTLSKSEAARIRQLITDARRKKP